MSTYKVTRVNVAVDRDAFGFERVWHEITAWTDGKMRPEIGTTLALDLPLFGTHECHVDAWTETMEHGVVRAQVYCRLSSTVGR